MKASTSALLAMTAALSVGRAEMAVTQSLDIHPNDSAPRLAYSAVAKGVPPMAYRGGRGPIKRNKAKRWHCKRLAKKVR